VVQDLLLRAMHRRLRLNRFAALLAVFALFCASSAYLAHGYDAKNLQHKAAHCDLCLQFSGGSADAPPAPSIVHVADFVVRLPLLTQPQTIVGDRKDRAHQPRAPPGYPSI
jgi:hypothetical protein